MIGIIIITHGLLGEEFVKVTEHIMGPQEQMLAFRIGPDDDVETRRDELLAAINILNSGEGVVILTDMFGGTPSNIALSLMGKANIEIIAGFNLPLLVKLLSVRKTKSLQDAVHDAQEDGRKYIHVASQVLNTGAQEKVVNE